MADIFISYAREDRARIERLAAALEAEGLSVWWDKNLAGGADFSKETEAKLGEAKAIVVAWSKASVDSMWVGDEATVGREKGNLVPIAIDPVSPRLGFRGLHTIDLAGWHGDRSAPGCRDLVGALKAKVSGAPAPDVVRPAKASWADKLRSPRTIAAIGAATLALVALLVVDRTTRSSFETAAPRPPQNEGVADISRPEAPGASPASKEAPLAPPAASIAVLPFADLSPQQDQAYFSDGVAGEILNVLARVEGLTVASRTSSFQFKGQEKIGIPVIAGQLNVRYVLEGSVRKAGDTIRIAAQLIDADTDSQLWSQSYDRTLTTENIFAVQDEITKAIVEQLSSRMSGASSIAAPDARSADTADTGAYALFLEGQTRLALRGRENILRSMAALERATEIDPGFARAWSVLAAGYSLARGWLSGADLDRDFPALAEGAAQKAIALDPSLSLPYAVLGAQAGNRADYEAAFSSFEQATARPGDASGYMWRANLWRDLGFFDRAIADYDRCLARNLDYNICREGKATAKIVAGDIDGGLATLKENLRRGFDQGAQVALWGAYLSRGDDAEFLYEMNEIVRSIAPGDMRWAVDMIFRAQTDPAYDRKDALRIFEARLDGMDARLAPQSFTETIVLFLFGAYDRMHPVAEGWWWATTGFPEWAKSPERKRLMRERKLDVYWRKHGFPPRCKPLGRDDFECK